MLEHASDTRYVRFVAPTLAEAEVVVTAWRLDHPTWRVTRIDYDFDEEVGDFPCGWWVDIHAERAVTRKLFTAHGIAPETPEGDEA